VSGLVATVRGVRFADGTTADVELVATDVPADERRVFAAAVYLLDAAGDIALVHSVRRSEWGPPGGWREGSESVLDNAIRETREECGNDLSPADLVPVGYEQFHNPSGGGLWRPGQDVLQVYRADLSEVRPPLTAGLDDTSDREWVDVDEFERRCGGQFHWALSALVTRGG
jgi:8-oxo-dGTP pyrophosphatase MutT (NUDIX family)